MDTNDNKVVENVDVGVYLSPSAYFIKPTTIYNRLYGSSLISNFGGYIKAPNNFGALYGVNRKYHTDGDGNDAPDDVFVSDLSKQDYENNVSNQSSIQLELKQSTIIPMLEKTRTAWSVEALQDYMKLAKASHDEYTAEIVIAKELISEILLQSDNRAINLAKQKATKLTASVRNDAFANYDIIQEVQKAGLASDAYLFAQTSISAFVSPSIAMELMSNPEYKPFVATTGEILNDCVYFKGSIKNINIFVDLFGFIGDDKFALVGVKDNERVDNASIVKVARKFALLESYDDKFANNYFFASYQYGIAFNPSDNLTEANADDSKLLHYIKFN